MRTAITLGIAAAIASSALVPTNAIAQVDYHRAQQAGKVWQRKQADNVRRDQARGEGRGDYHAPLTQADRSAAMVTHRVRYNRMVENLGKKTADSWLDAMARADRAKR